MLRRHAFRAAFAAAGRVAAPAAAAPLGACLSPAAPAAAPLRLRPTFAWPMHARAYALPAHQIIAMPALSPTMTMGNIAGWKKKEGDKLIAGDAIADIETDKATLTLESMEECFLAKILVADGAKDVGVGVPLCVTVEDAAHIASFASYKGVATPVPKPVAAAAVAAPAAPKPTVAPKTAASAGPASTAGLNYYSDAGCLSGEAGWVPGRRPF